jgi:hypothetical protein
MVNNPFQDNLNNLIQYKYPNFFDVSKNNGYFGEYEFPNSVSSVVEYHKSSIVSYFVYVPAVVSYNQQNGKLVQQISYTPNKTVRFTEIPYIDFGNDTVEEINKLAKESSQVNEKFNISSNKFYSKYICYIAGNGELKPRTVDYTFYNYFDPMSKDRAGYDMVDYKSFMGMIPIISENERKLLNNPFGQETENYNPQVTNDLHTKTYFRQSLEYYKDRTLKEMVKMSFGDMTIKMKDGTIKKGTAKENVFPVIVEYNEQAPNNNSRLRVPVYIMEIYNKHLGTYGHLDADLITTVNSISSMGGENQALLRELLSNTSEDAIKEVLEEVKKRKSIKNNKKSDKIDS